MVRRPLVSVRARGQMALDARRIQNRRGRPAPETL